MSSLDVLGLLVVLFVAGYLLHALVRGERL